MPSQRRTLFEISADLREIEDALEANGGEFFVPEMETYFDRLGDERDLKVDSYCYLIDELDAHAKYLRAEAKRLADWAGVNENKVRRLKERLMEFFQAHHIDRLTTPHWKPRIQVNGGLQALNLLVEPQKLPEEFQRIIIEPDTDLIREVLRAGQDLEFAELLPRGFHLRLK